MATAVIDLDFEIGDKVYHITPESEVGVIINWRAYGYSKVIEYLVTFNPNLNDWYYEQELSKTKLFYE